jgi:hypothetical protein
MPTKQNLINRPREQQPPKTQTMTAQHIQPVATADCKRLLKWHFCVQQHNLNQAAPMWLKSS